MLGQYLTQLGQELQLPTPSSLDKDGYYPFALSPDVSLQFQELKPGLSFRASLAPVPSKAREFLFLYLLKANFLGQGTGGRVLGIDAAEQFFVLSHHVTSELSYSEFKGLTEEFVNYLCYWQTEVKRLQKAPKSDIF